LKKKLVPIKTLQNVHGVQLPAGLNFIQLVVTGPPGAGKTYYINKIHGWPNEGYLDLTRKGWWKDRTLVFRPREIHLGLPFKGIREPLTVFDEEWLEAPEPPELEPERIKIPPLSNHFFQSNWRERYIFEFLLPKARTIFAYRKKRRSKGYFPVDENLSLKMVRRQLAVYRQVAYYLHQQGMHVYVRLSLDKPPYRFLDEEESQVPRWATGGCDLKPDLTTPAGWKWLLLRRDPHNWIQPGEEWQTLPCESRIAYDGYPFTIRFGTRTLLFSPEISFRKKKQILSKNWVVTDPEGQDTGMRGFTLIQRRESVMIGRANDDYHQLFRFPKKVAKRHLQVVNLNGDLVITPLDDRKRVEVRRGDHPGYHARIREKRQRIINRIRSFYGGAVHRLPPDDALRQIREVNAILAAEPFRPRNAAGRPGALVELLDTVQVLVVGDLHARVNNLLKILSENKLLPRLTTGDAYLVILGDAVHPEVPGEMEDMESSVLIMDLILQLKRRFPRNFFYLRGNHDSFNPGISKDGIPQGILMKKRLMELRGRDYVDEMERFHGLLPYIAKSSSFVACHAAPPWRKVSRKKLINLKPGSKIARELITGRLKRSNSLAGYGAGDVKRFRKSLDLPKHAPFIVGHTPYDSDSTLWRNVHQIKGHHVVYSGRPEGPGAFLQVNKKMIPLRFSAEPLMEIINKMG